MTTLIGGAVGGIGSLVGGLFSGNASQKAAGQISGAIQQGVNFGQGVYNNTLQNVQPFIGAGQSALPYLLGFYGLPGGNAGGAQQSFQQFTGTPSYQFPLQQGNLALNRQLASSGLIGSGAALKDAIGYNQGYASQGLGTYLQGLQGLITGGQNTALQAGQIGNQAASIALSGYTGIGGAQGAGTIGANNALNTGIGNALGQFTNPTFLNSLNSAIGGGTSAYTGPSAGSLIGGPGNPSYLQGQLGLGSGQYVP